SFIRSGRASGEWLDEEDERWASQGLLDYWSTLMYRAGQEPPDSTLAEFAPGNAPQVDECPYLGLDAFGEAQQSFFFGRRRLIDEMVTELKGNRLLSVVGPSGSGKSSLVLAGLMSALKAGATPGSRNWRYVPPMVPGSEPLANLARVLRPSTVSASDWDGVQIQCFKQNPHHLAQLLEKLYHSPTVLVVDQFEELFTLCLDDGARRAFIDNLIHLLQAPDNEHTLIITMRVDFEPYVARLPDFMPLFEKTQVRVTPLSAGELREAIEHPAELVGLKFEAGVVDALVQDILGEPAALPLLQFTLLKLWEARQRNLVTWEAYRRLGGGRQALASSA
ncbi:MAG: ATP-binding protein, partial [Delftia sp.]|nr:ATP-binding protein [Delftia sp.]